jgi:hypothetical protein
MLDTLRARLRRRRGRVAIVSAVALLGAAVAMAHTSVADDHMGEAAAICLAIVVSGAAVAALPALGGLLPRPRAPLELGGPRIAPQGELWAPGLPRGDPALLQVFRR